MAVLSIYRYHHTETEYLNVTDPVINSETVEKVQIWPFYQFRM
jgi:hypothetical protein